MRFVLIFILFFSQLTFAETFGVFPTDGQSAKIIVQGNDLDAINLYNSLKVDVSQFEYKLEKTASVFSSMPPWHLIYDISCSKMVVTPTVASCTINMHSNYNWTKIYPEEKSIIIVPYGDQDTFASYSEFVIPKDSDTIYTSKDQSLRISVERGYGRTIARFRLEYN